MLEVDGVAIQQYFAIGIIFCRHFELSFAERDNMSENFVELFNAVLPPCRWSRDRNCGHVTRNLVTWPNKPPPGDAGSRAGCTTRSDQGHTAGRDGRHRGLATLLTQAPSIFGPMSKHFPHSIRIHLCCSFSWHSPDDGPSLTSVEKRNFATARSRRHRRAATNHSPRRDYTEPRTAPSKSGRLCARVYLGHSSGSRLEPTFFCPPSCKLDLCC